MQTPASPASSIARTSGSAPPRSGQVPEVERPPARLCFFSLSSAGAEEAPIEGWKRLHALGLGLALGLEPSPRGEIAPGGVAGLVRRARELFPSRVVLAAASTDVLAGSGTILEQLEAVASEACRIEEAGGVPLLQPLAALARRRAREDEYVEIYRALLARLAGPVLVDWMGARARPELQDYFPGKSFERVMALDPAKVRGARLALSDFARETRLRRELLRHDQFVLSSEHEHLAFHLLGLNPGPAAPRLPAIERHTEFAGQRVALGDFSHVLLGGSLTEAETLASALARLEAGDAAGAFALLE